MVQFQVKHEQSIDCGGGYVKVRKRLMFCVQTTIIFFLFLNNSIYFVNTKNSKEIVGNIHRWSVG